MPPISCPSPAGKVDAVIIQKLALFIGFAALGLPALGRLVPGLLFRRGLAAAEKAVQKREGSGFAIVIAVRISITVGVEAHIHKAFDAV